jgi:S-adenosylmethionine hydrolase
MARSQNSFMKLQRERKRKKKKEEKLQRKLERKDQGSGGKLDDMIAYVDDYGNITSTPPETKKQDPKKPNDSTIAEATKRIE